MDPDASHLYSVSIYRRLLRPNSPDAGPLYGKVRRYQKSREKIIYSDLYLAGNYDSFLLAFLLQKFLWRGIIKMS